MSVLDKRCGTEEALEVEATQLTSELVRASWTKSPTRMSRLDE